MKTSTLIFTLATTMATIYAVASTDPNCYSPTNGADCNALWNENNIGGTPGVENNAKFVVSGTYCSFSRWQQYYSSLGTGRTTGTGDYYAKASKCAAVYVCSATAGGPVSDYTSEGQAIADFTDGNSHFFKLVSGATSVYMKSGSGNCGTGSGSGTP